MKIRSIQHQQRPHLLLQQRQLQPEGQATDPPAAPPATPPAATPPAEEQITLSSKQLADRLARERGSYLKELGFDGGEAELKKLKADKQKAEEDRIAAERAKMSETERAKVDAERAAAAQRTAEQRASAAEFEARVTREGARAGVRNIDYLIFEVTRATEALPEGETLNLSELVKKLGEDPTKRAALGLGEAAPQVQQQGAPVTTTPSNGGAPQPPTPGGGGGEAKDAFTLPPTEWARRKADLGV